MAEQQKDTGGLLDLEGELTCSICTDLLYAPLTLLDCLHSFCGSCLKEWFAWQATANTKRSSNPYTCPSCRESVRDTKVDWRLTTLLEGFLKANPDRGKTQEEKDEASRQYKPGDNVIPPVQVEDEDSEDERLLANVREMSMADARPRTAGMRADRARARHIRDPDRSPGHRSRQHGSHRYGEIARESEHRHVEHQPSLRSLLSDSNINSEDVQQEILQSIYSEGLLDGIDVDNLTAQQEEELTERIAEAYRRRQRNRERSRNRDTDEASSRSPRHSGGLSRESEARGHRRTESMPSEPSTSSQQPQPRARPPISRPHLFEHTTRGAERTERRSASSSSHRRQTSSSVTPRAADGNRQPARSATDLSQSLTTPPQRVRASSSHARRTTDPSTSRNEAQQIHDDTSSLQLSPSGPSPRPRSRESATSRPPTGTRPGDGSLTRTSAPDGASVANEAPAQASIRPIVSTSALAPEPVTHELNVNNASSLPSIACSRCDRQNIETTVHYHCPKCNEGTFNLCLQCYRDGRGCNHWFGFGFMATHSWQRYAAPAGNPRAGERPHILVPRRFVASTVCSPALPYPDAPPPPPFTIQEGAFCDNCFTLANDCYWYCEVCLFGAWGFCNPCILRGKHCTHPLLPLAHISALQNFSHEPSKLAFLPVPHLKDHSYILRPVLTDCDICHREIPSQDARFHCYQCGDGDYDVCNECYDTLVQTGQISPANGPDGWRRCLRHHRMAIVGYRNTPHGGGQVRINLADPVGGWRLREDPGAHRAARPPPSPPPQSVTGQRYLATWSRFPPPEMASKDELTFPHDAEIREGEDLNDDWAVGVYAGTVGVFPRNHTKRI